MSSSTHTADFQTATVKANDLDAVAKINVGLETDQDRKHLNIVADAPEIRIQDKTGSAPEVNATTMAIVADGGATHFRAGTTTFAEGAETKGNVKFQSSTGATTHAEIVGSSGKLELQDGGLGLKLGSNVSVTGTSKVIQEITGPHDRPLTKYPEVVLSESSVGATTHTSQGYTISSSSTRSVNNSQLSHAFNDFDNTSGNRAWTSDNGYSTSTGLPTSGNGDYIQIYLPGSGIKLDHTTILTSNQTGWNNPPRDVIIYGSNDGVNWTTLNISTDLPLNNGEPLTAKVHVGASTYYRYFRLRVTKTYIASGNSTYTKVAKWSLYGYEEGDVSTDVTLSSVYNKPGTEHLEVYWDANDTSSYAGSGTTVTDLSGNGVTGTLSGAGFDSTYNAFTFDGSGDPLFNGSGNFITGTLSNPSGDWVHSVSCWVYATELSGSRYRFVSHYGVEATRQQVILAIKNGRVVVDFNSDNIGKDVSLVANTWYHVAFTYPGGGTSRVKIYINGIDIGASGGGTTALNIASNRTLYIGKELNINWNDPWKGSIANFRIFSKVLSAEQVKELYDWQKDHFLGARSSMTLYQGNLGLGVAEPTARLEIAGNERLQEYPPRAMTGNDTYMEGHGVYRATASSEYASSLKAYTAFDNTTSGFWHSASSYSTATGYNPHTGSQKITAGDGTVYSGEWIQLSMPYQIHLKRIGVSPRTTNYNRGPHTATLLARRNGGDDWVVVSSWGSLVWTTTEALNGVIKYIEVNSEQPYSEFVMVVHLSNDSVNISQMKFLGTPVPSTLDDGKLTLGKQLTTPRISGHAAGAETPRAESLVVHYDTTVNSSPTDISGQGNHGTFNGNAAYSSSERAFSFDGTGDFIKGTISSSLSGNHPYSFSIWVKPYTIQSGYIAAFEMGNRSNNQACGLYLNGGVIIHVAFANNLQATTSVTANQWMHIVGTYTSGSRKVYADGVLLASDSYSSMNIGATEMTLGANNDDSQAFNGSISNFKVWDVALTADEVRTEYALGRTGKALNVTDTAVCIGGTAPRAQLDVRGSMIIDGIIKHSAWPAFRVTTNDGETIWSNNQGAANAKSTGHNGSTNQPDEIIPWKNVVYDNTGSYTYSGAGDYKFTAPVSGIYHFHFHCLFYRLSTSSNRLDLKFYVNGAMNTQFEMQGDFSSTNALNVSRGHTTDVHLNAGDYVQVAFNGIGDRWNVYWGSGSKFNIFTGHLIVAD